jgi:chorismate mutase/prephenate dehydratase
MKTIVILLAFMTLFTRNTKAGSPERLTACRQEIDSIDQRLVQLIQERARVVQEVGSIKREAHLPVTDKGREQLVIEKAEELAKAGPLPPEAVGRIYQKLVEEMRNWEADLNANGADSVNPEKK